MKKTITYVLIAVLLIAGMFILTGCNKAEEEINEDVEEIAENLEDTTNSDSITLTLDSEANKKEYKINFESNTDDNQMHFDSQYPTTAQIRNENGNYVIDIQINELTKAEYDITIAEEKKRTSFKEEKIGSFDGYSYTDENTETTTAKALIDGSNPDARIYATMIIGLEDESNSHGLTSQELYKSSKVQFIINSITCTETNTSSSSKDMSDKDYYEKAAEFVRQERLKDEDDMLDKQDYKKFVEYEGFGVGEEKGVTYAYMWIGDSSYYIENGEIESGPGSSTAYKVKFENGEAVSYENPTDGAGQEESIKEMFPADVAKKIMAYNFDFTRLDNAAKEYYNK